MIAFLRGLNVGGRVVKMEWLRQQFVTLGFSHVHTFIASGNVLFETRARDTAALERKIGARLGRALGYNVAVFIRTPQELAAIARSPAFPESDPAPRLPDNIIFLAEPLGAAEARDVLALRTTADDYRVGTREIYWRRRGPAGARAYSTAGLERALRRPFTVRTADTVKAIAALCGPHKGDRDAKAAVPVRAHDVGRGQRRGARRPRRAHSGRDH